MEQISVCVRFVPRKDGEYKVELTEDFPRFVEAENTKGVAIAEKFINTLTEFGINTHKMRAQGYDGAANMLGVHRGTQAVRVEQHVPDAVYCHYKAHSLHLAIGHSCGKPLIRNMYSTSHTNHLCPSQRTNALMCKGTEFEKEKMGELGCCFIYLPLSVPSSSSGARDPVPG